MNVPGAGRSRRGGEDCSVVRVEVHDREGGPVSGFTAAQADKINGNYIRGLASWQGSTDVSSLAERLVRLRFLMQAARLYSFQFLS